MTKIFKEAGGYLDVRSCNDLPRDRKQVTNLKYSKSKNKKNHQLVVKNNIIKLIDMCSFQKSNEEFMGNISVVPEKIVLLMNDRLLTFINSMTSWFCKSDKAISITGVDPTYNIGPCFVKITTYRHL